ncbi:tyrosine type site-specific recombinase [Bacteroides sp. CAG:443]|uniref:site-specific integrase n=2 Tax=Phocaeicola coprocola TaxID=310298 RepID=UPI00033C2010|nr:site-specific integrase [Phocaeicola coprocola]CDB97419.1 tyrosine type site-specific recombinase [Bacteroides sp. CAG:443]
MAREERETMSILFFIKKTKLLKNGEAPICLRLTLNKQIAEIRIKRSILVNRWSPAKGCALGKDRVAKELNSYLEAIRLKIHQIHRELVLDMSAPVTANAIMNRYCGNDVKMLLEVFEDHNDKCRALIGKEYVEGTVRKFDTTLLYLKQFLKQRYRKDDIPLPEINQEFVRDFEFFLKTEKSCQNNSALKHIKNFRKVIRIAIGNDWIKRDPFFGLRFKAEEVNVDFLSNDELKRIRQKKITIPRLERIRDIFVFCCFTGLAFVDVSQLTAEDLIKDAQGNMWIRKMRQKTKEMCNIPLLSAAKEILEKYKDFASTNAKGLLLPVSSNQKTNAYLKEIADICGIKKKLTTHVARHTAATVVFLANRVSMENVAKILGHANLNMTRHYAKVLDQSILNDMENVERSFRQ